ncbi:MAG: hypothetical protein TECD_01191 [Hyphomicrobiaceae bacterium hypho_1]
MKKPDDISDSEAIEASSDPDQRKEIMNFLAENKVSIPLEKLPSEVLKAALADIYNRKVLSQMRVSTEDIAFFKPENIKDEIVSRAINNDEMREALKRLFEGSNYDDPLTQAPPEKIKAGILAIILCSQNIKSKSEQPYISDVSYEHVSNEMLDAALENRKMREIIQAALKTLGVNKPINQVPRKFIKALFSAIGSMAHGKKDAIHISNNLLEQIFSDPKASKLLRDVMRHNNLKGEPINLPDITKRKIVSTLVQRGAIVLGTEQTQ